MLHTLCSGTNFSMISVPHEEFYVMDDCGNVVRSKTIIISTARSLSLCPDLTVRVNFSESHHISCESSGPS